MEPRLLPVPFHFISPFCWKKKILKSKRWMGMQEGRRLGMQMTLTNVTCQSRMRGTGSYDLEMKFCRMKSLSLGGFTYCSREHHFTNRCYRIPGGFPLHYISKSFTNPIGVNRSSREKCEEQPMRTTRAIAWYTAVWADAHNFKFMGLSFSAFNFWVLGCIVSKIPFNSKLP